jgi:hypothetical protein
VPKLPDMPGLEAAGVIEAVGDGVIGLRVGMRVGTFASKTDAEYCLAPVTQVVSLPDGVSLTDGAAFLIQGLTAYHLLHTAYATGPVAPSSFTRGRRRRDLAVQLARPRARVYSRPCQVMQGRARQGEQRRRCHQLCERSSPTKCWGSRTTAVST